MFISEFKNKEKSLQCNVRKIQKPWCEKEAGLKSLPELSEMSGN